MFGRLSRWIGRLFGREAREQQRELVELARQGKSDPNNERLILRLGDLYLRSGDKERALSAYWHVVDLYKKRQDWPKASAVLRRVALLAPAEMIARFELAHCYEKMERRREAAEQWELAAVALEAKNDIDGALRCYSRAVSLDPLATHLAHRIEMLRPAPVLAPLPKPVAPLAQPQPVPAPHVKPNLASLGAARGQPKPPREDPGAETALDNPLDGHDLGVDLASTTEYSAEDLSTLLDQNFGADTVAVESLPLFDEEHRPRDTPSDPLVLSP